MEYILTAEEKHLADGYTSEKMHVGPAVLMERAALAACDVLTERKLPLDNICIVCGPGNNGGDGLALARILAEKGKRAAFLTDGQNVMHTIRRAEKIRFLGTINGFNVDKDYLDAKFPKDLSDNLI